jgi:hypothetical protein
VLKESNKNTKEEKEEEDILKIQEIFTELNLNNIKVEKHYRIKSSKPDANKPSILVVELSSKTEQAQVLQESRNLNNLVAYKDKVYINPDLTIAERASLRMLLTERNKLNKIETDGKTPFRWIIRNDRLEKFKPKNLK